MVVWLVNNPFSFIFSYLQDPRIMTTLQVLLGITNGREGNTVGEYVFVCVEEGE